MSELARRIRAQETPFYAMLYRVAKRARNFEVPVWGPLARVLLAERSARLAVWRNFWRLFYYQPLFRARCATGGSVYIEGAGLPLVMGSPEIRLGRRVRINAQTTITAHKLCSEPVLSIGDDVYIGSQVSLSVGSRIVIGDRVLIASGVFLAGYDGHPVDPIARSRGDADEVPGPIVIGDDAWIGSGAFVRKGTRIGRCAVVAAGSVVVSDVPDGAIVGGNPARILKQIEALPDAEALERALAPDDTSRNPEGDPQ